MIKRNRGIIFGTSGRSNGQTTQRPVYNPSTMRIAAQAANTSQQFGRSLSSMKSRLSGRSKRIRR